MLASVTDCRRSWKWGCRGRLALGFKPRLSSPARRGPRGFGGVGTPQLERESGPRGFRVLLFAMQLRKKRDERTLAGGS